MVQWTDKPAAKPQIATEERKPDTASPRPVLRKPRRRRLVGALQVLTICSVFGLILASYFTFKETRGDQAAATPERGAATGRIVVMDRTPVSRTRLRQPERQDGPQGRGGLPRHPAA